MNEEILKKTVISQEIRLRVEKVIFDCITKAQSRFGNTKINRLPFLRFATKGRCAGWAHWSYVTGDVEININPILLNENVEYVINQTVPHEVAHIVAYMVYGRVKAHGWEWKAVMRLFGKEPNRCHMLDTSTVRLIRKPRQRRFVNCTCPRCGMVLTLSIVRARKMVRGKRFIHPSCGGILDSSCLAK